MAEREKIVQIRAAHSLREAFSIHRGEVISLVGGGGKTTLMFALARELASPGGCVITTTTTKILEPLPAQSPLLLMEADEAKLMESVLHNVGRYWQITLAREKSAFGKLSGVSPEFIVKLAQIDRVSYIIIEADGAARKPLKAPNATEPVIPPNTSLVIPVVGIDALGSRLSEEIVFRSDIAARLLGVPLGKVISAESIALLITHEQGIIKGSPARARITPFINKVDLPQGLDGARGVAGKVLAVNHPQIRQVVLGQARMPQPVVELVYLADTN